MNQKSLAKAHDRRVVGSIPMLDGSGVKAMPG